MRTLSYISTPQPPTHYIYYVHTQYDITPQIPPPQHILWPPKNGYRRSRPLRDNPNISSHFLISLKAFPLPSHHGKISAYLSLSVSRGYSRLVTLGCLGASLW